MAVRSRRGDFEPQLINGTLWKVGLKMSDKADDVGLVLMELNVFWPAYTVLLVLAYLRISYRRWTNGFAAKAVAIVRKSDDLSICEIGVVLLWISSGQFYRCICCTVAVGGGCW